MASGGRSFPQARQRCLAFFLVSAGLQDMALSPASGHTKNAHLLIASIFAASVKSALFAACHVLQLRSVTSLYG